MGSLAAIAASIIPILVILAVIRMFTAGSSVGEQDYVLKHWHVSPVPDANGSYVDIMARRAGVISYLLNLMGISPTRRFRATSECFYSTSGSWSLTATRVMTTDKVSSVTSGYSRPIGTAVTVGFVTALIMMGLAAGSGGGGGDDAFVGLVVGIAFGFGAAAIVLNVGRRLVFWVASDSGERVGIRFKPAVIEGISVDEVGVVALVDVLTAIILAADPGTRSETHAAPARTIAQSPRPVPQAPPPPQLQVPPPPVAPVAAGVADPNIGSGAWWS